MELDWKSFISRTLNWVQKYTSSVIGVTINKSGITTNGTITVSVQADIPDGYEIVPNCRPVGMYMSGDASCYVTDRSVVAQNGDYISFTCYVHNPSNKNLALTATILCRRTLEYPLITPEHQTYFEANWTATSSNAVGIQVTDTISLPAGVYVIMGKAPVITGTTPGFSVRANGATVDDIAINNIITQQGFTTLLKFDAPTTIYLATAGSSSVTYSYLERGGLRAVRVA